MTTSLRIIAVLLGLLGVERIIYADIFSVLPRIGEPTPALNMAMGVFILVTAVGLLLGFGWARWSSVLGATLVALQGLAYATTVPGWDSPGVLFALLEPLVASVIAFRLVRHWPTGVSWNQRLS